MRALKVGAILAVVMFAAVMFVAGVARAGDPPASPAGKPAGGPTGNISEADKYTAKELVASGDAKLEKGDYIGALNDYRGADEIMRVPTTGVEVARTLLLLNRLLEGREAYRRVAAYPVAEDEPEPFTRARDKAKAALADLEARIPHIVVRVKLDGRRKARPEPEVALDGKSVAAGAEVETDPGKHHVTVGAPGYQSERRTVTIAEGKTASVAVTLSAVAEPPPDRTKHPPDQPATADEIPFWTWIGVSVAGVGVIAGAATGIVSLGKASDFQERQLPSGAYPESSRSLQEQSITLAHISTVSFAVGGAGAAVAVVGIVLWATGHEEEARWLGRGPTWSF